MTTEPTETTETPLEVAVLDLTEEQYLIYVDLRRKGVTAWRAIDLVVNR